MDLLDRQDGFVAKRMRERLGADREADTLARVDRMEKLLAYRLRQFKGIRVESQGKNIVPGRDGWLAVSTDDNSQFKRKPNQNPHHMKLEVTPGCTAAIVTNIDCDDTSVTATACLASVDHVGGNGYVAVQHAAGSTANAQILEYNWCAPAGSEPEEDELASWKWGWPDIWARLTIGDECSGDCQTYVFPGYAEV